MNPSVAFVRGWLAVVAGVGCLASLLPSFAAETPAPTVSLVVSSDSAKPIQHGLTKLKAALGAKGVSFEEIVSFQQAAGSNILVAGLSSGAGEVAKLITEWKLSPRSDPESVLIKRGQREGKT